MGKLRVGNEVNNGTGGQQMLFFEHKPCHFNTIGGVTGTRRAFESRTKEQGTDRGGGAERRLPALESHQGCQGRAH